MSITARKESGKERSVQDGSIGVEMIGRVRTAENKRYHSLKTMRTGDTSMIQTINETINRLEDGLTTFKENQQETSALFDSEKRFYDVRSWKALERVSEKTLKTELEHLKKMEQAFSVIQTEDKAILLMRLLHGSKARLMQLAVQGGN